MYRVAAEYCLVIWKQGVIATVQGEEMLSNLIYLEIARARSSMEIMMTPRSDVGKTSIAKVPNMFFGDVRCKNIGTWMCREEPET